MSLLLDPDRSRDRLAALRQRLGARAAGAWRREGDQLLLIGFDPDPDLPPEVARGFEDATRSVGLDRAGLGIALAAATAEVAVSIAADLPADSGSGRWLRAFDAARSVAVPILGEGGRVEAVVSIALGLEPGDEAVAAAIRDEVARA